MQPAICEIDFSLDDSRNSTVRLIERLERFLQQLPAGRDAVIDLSRVQYLGPFTASVLLAYHLSCKGSGRPMEILRPRKKKAAKSMHSSGLDHFLFGLAEPDINHPDNVTVPLQVIQKSAWTVANPVIELARKHAVLSNDDEEYLRICVYEAIQNVDDHAQSGFGAVYCARYLAKPQTLRVGIVDGGLGIGKTLSQKYPNIDSAATALRRVVDGGLSARSHKSNLGLGVSNIWAQVTKQLKGEIFILTEDAAGYNEGQGSLRLEQISARFAGTGVFFTVPLKAREAMREKL